MPASVLGSEEEEIYDFPALGDHVDPEGARVHQTELSQMGEVTPELTRSLLANVQCWDPNVRFTSVF